MQNQTLAAALRGTPAADVLQLTKALYAQVMEKIKAGDGTQEDIAACNAARKEIAACEKLGVGK